MTLMQESETDETQKVVCDICNNDAHFTLYTDDDGEFVRRSAARKGWIYVAGKDICKRCQTNVSIPELQKQSIAEAEDRDSSGC